MSDTIVGKLLNKFEEKEVFSGKKGQAIPYITKDLKQKVGRIPEKLGKHNWLDPHVLDNGDEVIWNDGERMWREYNPDLTREELTEFFREATRKFRGSQYTPEFSPLEKQRKGNSISDSLAETMKAFGLDY